MRRTLSTLVALLGLWATAVAAQVPLDPRTMGPAEIESLQRRLVDARCYAGSIDGVPNAALTEALATCPDQRPVLRIETGMHASSIKRIATDAHCGLLVSGSEDKTVRLWSMPEGRPLRTQRLPVGDGDLGKIMAVAMSPDGRMVAAGGWDAHIKIDKKVWIYLFDVATGQDVRRIGPFDEIVSRLAFSADGTRLAAALVGSGIRVLDVATGRELAADREAGREQFHSVTFTPDGGLLAVSFGGFLYRYAPDGRRLAKVTTRGGREPFSVAVDPEGKHVAVGYNGTAAVSLYDLPDLRARSAADTADIDHGDFSTIAWSADGQRLYAAGQYGRPPKVRVFDADGHRRGVDVVASDNTLTSLVPCGDAMAFSASDPSFGLISAAGAVTTLGKSRSADMRGKTEDGFTVSDDGLSVRFGLDLAGYTPVLFDLATGTLTDGVAASAELHAPDATSLPVTGWQNAIAPRLGGQVLALKEHEISRALAVRPGRAGFVLGTDYKVRAFDGAGKQRWDKDGPGAAWGVNVAKGGELIVVAYEDGTVRWLRWRDGHELLALFVNRDTRAWVAWTPTGYYAASPGAEAMIGWHVNRGWDQPADFFPASKFRDTYARPDIVQRVLETMDETDAIRLANAARPGLKVAKPISETLPPVVTIISPFAGTAVEGAEVQVDYLVRSPSGLTVDAVEALVDGRPASRERGLGRSEEANALRDCLAGARGLGRADGSPQGCRGSIIVPLPPGAEEIGLFARTGERAGDIARVRIVRAAAEAAGTPARKPTLYALVAGVSTYANPDYALQYAAKDARDFAAALVNQKGGLYDDVVIRMLTDAGASGIDIKDGLDWLTKHVTNRDIGLVFLAGHGVLDERDRFYFMAVDSSVDRLRATGVPREDIQDALERLPGKALLFLDACHAGAVGSSKVRRELLDINGVANEFTRTERGVVMFAASTGRQVSQENAAWGNGAFTKAVIEALGSTGARAKADLFGRGTISTSALDAYVSARVKELTDGRQSPVMIRPPTVPDFTLAAVR